MARIPPPAPVVVTKFAPSGEVLSAAVVKPEVIRRKSEWEPDEVRLTLRIMAEQETGEELFVSHAHNGNADRIIAEHKRSHPEHHRVWAESLGN